MFRCKESFGVKIGEPSAYIFGLHWNQRSRRQVRLRDWIMNRARVSAFEIAPEKLEEHLRTLLRFRPTHLLGYPSAVYDLCVLARDRGNDDLRKLKLKGIFLTAEPLRDYQREMITQVTGSRCVDTYGSAEGGMQVVECPHGSLHIQAEATWLQVRPVGELSGEALVTDMWLRAFPMIRYALGDEIVLKPGRCSCGRPHAMLASIEGRSGQPILLPDGRKVNANLPSYIFKPLTAYGVIRRYRFVDIPGETLKLYLVTTPAFNEGHLALVKQETRAAFGEDIPFSVHLIDRMPDLPNAKHRDYVRIEPD
jgi:phenylacetate-CoA ligase